SHPSSLDSRVTLLSQDPTLLTQAIRGAQKNSGTTGRARVGAAATSGTDEKALKEAQELERRRALQEQLDKEKVAKERAHKKKKLF
ncbi:hypothetical protein BX616_004463, partial [Lobosporangium transversale]